MNQKTMMRTSLALLLSGHLTVLVGCGGSPPTPLPEPSAEEKAVEVLTVRLEPQRVIDVASLPADLLPIRRAVLAAEVAGAVEEVRVSDGDRVKAGQVLAAIDTRALEQELAEAEALDRRAQARFQRASRLFEKQSITQQQLLDAVTDRDVALARLAGARLRLEKSQVRAPWKGQVVIRRIEVGDYVALGQPVIELIDASRLKVRGPAPASDVPYLKVGSPVTLRMEIAGMPPVTGQIVRLDAELNPSTRTLGVEAEIDNSQGLLKPGMYGRLEVVRRILPEALLVPIEALLDLGGKSAVYVVRDGKAWRVEIESGPVIGDSVVVERGLAPADHVVIAGQSRLGEGQRVSETETPTKG